jgi:hypothetical protein
MESAAHRIAFPLVSTRIGASSELSVTCKFELSRLETYHAPPLERVNSRTAFAACSNAGGAAIVYLLKHFRFAGEMMRRFLC